MCKLSADWEQLLDLTLTHNTTEKKPLTFIKDHRMVQQGSPLAVQALGLALHTTHKGAIWKHSQLGR